jgi:hypothetical protein
VADERGRGDLPHAGDAGDVVDLVAQDGHVVDHLLRLHAQLLLHLGGAGPPAAPARLGHGVVEGDPLPHQLGEVLVSGDDHHLPALLPRPTGQGGDDVVGLEARLLHHRDVEGPGHLAHQRELGPEVLGGLGPVGLVVGVEVVAKALSAGVQHHRRVGGPVLPERLEEHGGEAQDRVGGHAPRGGEVREGVVGAEDEPGPVDERQGGHGRAGTIAGRSHRRDPDRARLPGEPPCRPPAPRWPAVAPREPGARRRRGPAVAARTSARRRGPGAPTSRPGSDRWSASPPRPPR